MKIDYAIKKDHTAVITGIPEPEAVMMLPELLDDFPVTEIGPDIIPMGTKSIAREIILPPTVKSIGSRAFNDLRYLKRLILPDSLLEISDFGIFTCPDLTHLWIPASVKNLGNYAFGYMYEHGRAYRLNYFTLHCSRGSAAEKFAVKNHIGYVTE